MRSLTTTQCRLADTVPPPKWTSSDGDAAILPVGTPLRAVVGFDPAFRLGALVDGQAVLYEVERPVGARTGAEAFPGLRRHVTAIAVLSAQDGKTEIGRIDEPAHLAALVDELMAAPLSAPAGTGGAQDVFLGLRLDDGTTVTRAYVSQTGLLMPGLVLPQSFQDDIRALSR